MKWHKEQCPVNGMNNDGTVRMEYWVLRTVKCKESVS